MAPATDPDRIRTMCADVNQANLGCGDDYRSDWLNVDKRAAVNPDIVYDLDKTPWPFPDDAFEVVNLDNVLEHLRDQFATLRELRRITVVGGELHVSGPHWHSAGAWIDPTHSRPFDPRTFDHYLVDEWFEVTDLRVHRVRWGRLLPESAALWFADILGHGVSGFDLTVEVRK